MLGPSASLVSSGPGFRTHAGHPSPFESRDDRRERNGGEGSRIKFREHQGSSENGDFLKDSPNISRSASKSIVEGSNCIGAI